MKNFIVLITIMLLTGCTVTTTPYSNNSAEVNKFRSAFLKCYDNRDARGCLDAAHIIGMSDNCFNLKDKRVFVPCSNSEKLKNVMYVKRFYEGACQLGNQYGCQRAAMLPNFSNY